MIKVGLKTKIAISCAVILYLWLEWFVFPMTLSLIYLVPIVGFGLFCLIMILLLTFPLSWMRKLVLVSVFFVFAYLCSFADFSRFNLERYVKSNESAYSEVIAFLVEHPKLDRSSLENGQMKDQADSISANELMELNRLLSNAESLEIYTNEDIVYFCTSRMMGKTRGIAYSRFGKENLQQPAGFGYGMHVMYWLHIYGPWYCMVTA